MPIVKVGDQRIRFPDSMSQEEIQAALQKQFGAPQPEPSRAEALGRGVRMGGSFGGADEMGAAFGAGLDYVTGTDRNFRQNYESLRDTYREEEAAAQEAHPGTYLAGELAGGLTTGGAGAGRVAASQTIRQAPKLARFGAYSGLGAAEGAVAGAAYSTADEWDELAVDAGLGAGFGVAGSLVGPLLSGAGRLTRTLAGAGGEQRAMNRVGELLRATGLSPEEVAGQLNKLGPGSTLGDLDRWMTAELREALSKSTPEARAVLEALEQRTQAGRGRIAGQLSESLDAPATVAEQRAMSASDKIDAAKPMYDEAMETVVDVTKYPRLGRLVQFQPIKKAIRDAQKELSYGDRAVGTFDILHVAKRKLDDQIAFAKRNGLDDRARMLMGLKKDLLDQMDTMSADQGLAYREAREIYADASARDRALEAGQSLFRGRKSADEVGALVDGMSLAERQSFLSGSSEAAMEHLAYSTVKDPSKIFNAKNMALLRQVIPDDQNFQRLLSTIEAETQKMISGQVASGKVGINQDTLHGLGALVYGAAGNMNALAAVALNRVGQALSGMGANQRKETIKLLTRTGMTPDEIQEVMRFSNRGTLDAATKGVTISAGATTGGILAGD